jgi:sporulation protein YlmC with PRC-barrel domain
MVAAAALLLGGASASAQTAGKKGASPASPFFASQQPNQYLARDRLIGARVINKDGQTVGTIDDLIINSREQVEGVIMGVGGFLGVGEKKIGVRLSALRFSTKDGMTTITLPQATKEMLTALEPYQRAVPKKTLLQRAREKAKELTGSKEPTAADPASKEPSAKEPAGKAKK